MTISFSTWSRTRTTWSGGSNSTNYQMTGRELLTPDEVRMLDNRYALLFMRGECPIMDSKYDIDRHPNVRGTADGKAVPFRHGTVNHAVAASVGADWGCDPASLPGQADPEGDYELLSEEDLEILLNNMEENDYER